MYYGKIIVKSDYEKRGDLVLRSYVRALKKIKANLMLDGDNAFIYGKIDEEGKFHELFTGEVIDYEHFIYIPTDEYLGLVYLSLVKKDQIKKVINHVLFDKSIDFDFEISSMEELARDRAVEFDAYNTFLSRINPYMRLSEEEDDNLYNSYNNFSYKIEQLKIMEKLDQQRRDVDAYNVNEYVEEPKVLAKRDRYN